jgi:uncharacterized protein YbjT (DUF2867 family)
LCKDSVKELPQSREWHLRFKLGTRRASHPPDSVASADRQTAVPHFESKWQIERKLRAAQVPHTVIAPTYFFENLGDPGEVIATGELALPLDPTRPLQQVAPADLGALVAALVVRRHEFLGDRVEVAGDQPTPQQMAGALTAVSGRPVRYRRVALEHVAARSADLAAMYHFLEQIGYQVDISALRDRFQEVQSTNFATWVQRDVTHDQPSPPAEQRA